MSGNKFEVNVFTDEETNYLSRFRKPMSNKQQMQVYGKKCDAIQ